MEDYQTNYVYENKSMFRLKKTQYLDTIALHFILSYNFWLN